MVTKVAQFGSKLGSIWSHMWPSVSCVPHIRTKTSYGISKMVFLMAARWLTVAASGSSWIQEVPMMASEGLKMASDSCNIALKTI